MDQIAKENQAQQTQETQAEQIPAESNIPADPEQKDTKEAINETMKYFQKGEFSNALPELKFLLKKITIQQKIITGGTIFFLLFIIFLVSAANGKQQIVNQNTSPSTTPLPKQTKDNTTKINPLPQTIDKLLIYAKQTQTLHVNQKDWPILTIYSYDVNTQQQTKLFTVGGVQNTPQNFYFIKEKDQMLINLQHTLKIYDGKAGTLETLYNGNPNNDFITGSAVSNDEQQVAFNVTTGMISTTSQKDNLYIVDLNTKQKNLIFSQSHSTQNGLTTGWLSPYFWTPDNKAIVMNYIDTQNSILGMAEIAINGSNLHTLPNLLDSGQVSNDKNYYVYTQQSDTPAPWACQDQGMTSIQLFDTRTNANALIASDPISLFRIISWSPDNQQILYQQQKYQSGNGCSALFYDTQTFIYNLATQQTQQVTSPDDTLKTWSNFLTVNSDTEPNQTNLVVNGQVIDSVPAKQQLFSISTLN